MKQVSVCFGSGRYKIASAASANADLALANIEWLCDDPMPSARKAVAAGGVNGLERLAEGKMTVCGKYQIGECFKQWVDG